MIKGNKVLDLITGDYTGRWPNEFKPTDKGDLKKPIIRKSGDLKGLSVFPVPLNPDKNVKRVTSFNGKSIDLLVPSSDLYNFSDERLQRTILNQVNDDLSGRLQEKNNRIKELEDKVTRLQDELDKEDSSSVESSKYNKSGGGVDRLRCTSCGQVHRRSEWEESDGLCPFCRETRVESAEVIA